MAITSVHHIVIRVEDIDAGIATYRDTLGLELDRTSENEALGIKQAFFNIPAGGFIEIVAPTSPDSAVGKALAARGEGIHTIAFGADDVAATASAIKDGGGRLIGEGGPQVFVHPKTTHGMLLQLAAE